MFSYSYNYIVFLFNPELVVAVCFFLFLFFLLLQEKGQLGSYLQDLSIEARSKLSRHLSLREKMLQELDMYLDNSVAKIKKIMVSYEAASQDMLLFLQHIIKKLSNTYTVLQVKYYLNSVEMRTHYLSLQIRLYLTHDLFAGKSYKLTSTRKNKDTAKSISSWKNLRVHEL